MCQVAEKYRDRPVHPQASRSVPCVLFASAHPDSTENAKIRARSQLPPLTPPTPAAATARAAARGSYIRSSCRGTCSPISQANQGIPKKRTILGIALSKLLVGCHMKQEKRAWHPPSPHLPIPPRNFVLIDKHRNGAGLARAILITGKICERMSNLVNMFAALDLDADGDEEEVEQPTSSKPAAAAAAARKIGKSALFLSFPPRMDWEAVLQLVHRMRFTFIIARFVKCSICVNT